MSATGRNLEGNERHEHDFYETPGWATRAILPHLCRIGHDQPLTILDAGSGTGAIARECNAFFRAASTKGIEQEETLFKNAKLIERPGLEFVHGDFLSLPVPDCTSRLDDPMRKAFDLVIANPPYNNAQAFVVHALRLGATVAFLLRINWLASKKRAEFHRAFPCDLYVLPRRPSFTNGGTDATEYAWFVWGRAPLQVGGYRPLRGNRWFLLEVET